MTPAEVERLFARAAILPTAIAGATAALVAVASILLTSTRARASAAQAVLENTSALDLWIGIGIAVVGIAGFVLALLPRPDAGPDYDEDDVLGDASLLGREVPA